MTLPRQDGPPTGPAPATGPVLGRRRPGLATGAYWWTTAGVTAATLLATQLSLQFHVAGQMLAPPYWLAAGVMLAARLLWGPGFWPRFQDGQ